MILNYDNLKYCAGKDKNVQIKLCVVVLVLFMPSKKCFSVVIQRRYVDVKKRCSDVKRKRHNDVKNVFSML